MNGATLTRPTPPGLPRPDPAVLARLDEQRRDYQTNQGPLVPGPVVPGVSIFDGRQIDIVGLPESDIE